MKASWPSSFGRCTVRENARLPGRRSSPPRGGRVHSATFFRVEIRGPEGIRTGLTRCLTWRAGTARHRGGTGKAAAAGDLIVWRLKCTHEAAGRGDRSLSGAPCPALNLVPGDGVDIIGGAL